MTDVREQLQRAQAGDKEARNYLVQENIGLVKHIVSRYTARGVEKEDLFQIGMIGLLKAIDYFDLSYKRQVENSCWKSWEGNRPSAKS